MKISRTLKNSKWEFDFETKNLTLYQSQDNGEALDTFQLNKTKMFSLMRFCISVSQGLSRKKRASKKSEIIDK